MKHKVIMLSGLLGLLISATSCYSANTRINVDPNKGIYKVGISQYVRHESLDAAALGFKDELTRIMHENHRDVKYFDVNSQGETSLCTVSAACLVSKGVDLILANATPSFQAAVNATRTIPIVGNSITSYETALNIKINDDCIGTNATGTTDLPPLKQQAEMLFDLIDGVKEIGLIYCSSEANSLYQIEHVEQYIKEIANQRNLKDVKSTRYSFVDSNEIEQIVRKAAISSDALYVPTDNTCASSALTIKAACKNGQRITPLICGDIGTCRKAGIATLTIDYYDLGIVSGKMAADILLGKEKVEEMKIRYADNYTYRYNQEICKECNIEIDERFEGYVPIE